MPRLGFALLIALAAGALWARPSLAMPAASGAELADLCAAIDPAALGKSLGIAGAAQAHADTTGECHISFSGDPAELDLEVTPRAHFGIPAPGSGVTAIRGLGEHAVFDQATGSDGIPTQSLFVLQGSSGLTIQLMRHHQPGPQWHVALARQLLAKLPAKP